MKKLLLILMVVALASFLMVGCLGTGTVVDDDDDDDVVESDCPTVSITNEVEIDGKKYIKGASQTITVTFAEATEPVSVWVGEEIKDNPAGVPTDAKELVMYPDADKKVYTGTYRFTGGVAGSDCDEDYIYVTTCATCAPCKFPYVVDDLAPCSQITISEHPTTGCASCGGININFATDTSTCDICCGDECTDLVTATFDLYKADPFGECCDIPCLSVLDTCTSTDCDIDCTISCFNIYDYYTYVNAADSTLPAHQAGDDAKRKFYLVATLVDKVENKEYYYAEIVIDSEAIVSVQEFVNGTSYANCTDWSTAEDIAIQTGTSGTIGGCLISGLCDVPVAD